MRLGQGSQRSNELELVPGIQPLQTVAELGAEYFGQHTNGQQVVRILDPFPGSLNAQPASGHDQVQVVVLDQTLAPSMEHRGQPQFNAQPLAAQLEQSLSGARKQQVAQGGQVLAHQAIGAREAA